MNDKTEAVSSSIDTPDTNIHYRPISWLGTGTLIKMVRIYLFYGLKSPFTSEDITKILLKWRSRPITLTIYNYRATVIQSLEENGYAVIPNVLDTNDCDLYIKEYKDWAKQVENSGIPFLSFESLIQGYRTGHCNASWCVRLKVKDVFAQIWQTDKLLSSIDAVALSYPPEQGECYLMKRTQIYVCLFVCLFD